jgi:hypothetical protein
MSKKQISLEVKANNNFKGAANATVNDLSEALYVVAEEIMTDSKQNYVPVITGTLRRSGFVNRPRVQAGKVVIVIGYGGAARSYALAVHEAPITRGQGKNKYLSNPVNAAAAQIPARLATRMSQRLRRQGRI